MNCPICGDGHYEAVWRHSSGIANGLCLNCGHVYVAGSDSLDVNSTYVDFAQSYSDEYLLDPSTPIFAYARARAQSLREWKPDLGAVLEIGSGYGHFLHVLGDDLFRAGLEPSPAGAAFSRARFGLDMVIPGSLEQVNADWPGREVDAVCAFHVLEHLRDPFALLSFAQTRLTENGLLVIAVPELRTLNPDLIELYFLRRGWHLHTFSESTIGRLFADAGFAVIRIEPEAWTPMLRSSMRVIARFTGHRKRVPSEATLEASRNALRGFHDRLDQGLDALREQIGRWQACGIRVAIYGAGMHTRALFDLVNIDPSAIVCVIDDDPAKAGSSIAEVPCWSFADALTTSLDVILVSTLASEDVLLESLPHKCGAGIQIFGIYRDFLT
jgi:SAM-dependent methyltransferase